MHCAVYCIISRHIFAFSIPVVRDIRSMLSALQIHRAELLAPILLQQSCSYVQFNRRRRDAHMAGPLEVLPFALVTRISPAAAAAAAVVSFNSFTALAWCQVGDLVV